MKLILWFAALAFGVLAVWWVWGGGWDERLTFGGSVRWLHQAGPWAWAAGILLLASDLLLPVPGTIVVSALGYVYGTVVGGFIAAVGLAAAGLLGYGAGRLFGGSFGRRLLGSEDFEKGRRLFENGGGWMVAVSRALPILPEVISCTAGMVGMPFGRFVISLACGCLPMGFVFAAIGSAGHDAPAWSLALSLLIPAVLWWLADRIRKRNNGP